VADVRIQTGARLNVLLTEDRPHAPEHWLEQLPRLLEPQGIAAYLARTAQEALELVRQLEIHAAVIDMETPMGGARGVRLAAGVGGAHDAAGLWLLELFRRLPSRPPIVLVHNPVISRREIEHLLNEALRLGAFSVVSKPVALEQVLDVFRRLLDRQYRGTWPGSSPGGGSLS